MRISPTASLMPRGLALPMLRPAFAWQWPQRRDGPDLFPSRHRLSNGTLPEVWIPPSKLALVKHMQPGGFGPPRAALRVVAEPGLSTGSRLAEQVHVRGSESTWDGTEAGNEETVRYLRVRTGTLHDGRVCGARLRPLRPAPSASSAARSNGGALPRGARLGSWLLSLDRTPLQVGGGPLGEAASPWSGLGSGIPGTPRRWIRVGGGVLALIRSGTNVRPF